MDTRVVSSTSCEFECGFLYRFHFLIGGAGVDTRVVSSTRVKYQLSDNMMFGQLPFTSWESSSFGYCTKR